MGSLKHLQIHRHTCYANTKCTYCVVKYLHAHTQSPDTHKDNATGTNRQRVSTALYENVLWQTEVCTRACVCVCVCGCVCEVCVNAQQRSHIRTSLSLRIGCRSINNSTGIIYTLQAITSDRSYCGRLQF